MIKIGPAGGISTGKAWDEGGRDGITQIFVSQGDFINSLQFQFVENGTLVLSEKHGGRGGPDEAKLSVLRLNYPSEFLTGINGYHSSGRIVSLTFITNKGIYRQSGRLAGRLNHYDSSFEYKLGEDNTFGGFHGTADVYLNSIGVYMKPMTTLSNVKNPDLHVKNEKI
ncbi:protein RESTRICTED TEV MOVEMENT 1-like [Rhododendron vialii]|uniref:protein RESTRICTED TEV MOVEMENT 1-like n=1 Tax=Rhododendron vialii TaxID=182163 RepID=UPI00265D8A0F|nr:protein RESTRICTED TEV MOVEMENT 1-like [Rhododendron vialii]